MIKKISGQFWGETDNKKSESLKESAFHMILEGYKCQ